jgi:hypothetical protein
MNEMTGTGMDEMNEIIALFANFINYLNSSYYEYHFTHAHQVARLNLDSLLTEVSNTPQTSPTHEQCVSFYNNVRILENVTETDDPDYHKYKRLLRRYIAVLTPTPQ